MNPARANSRRWGRPLTLAVLLGLCLFGTYQPAWQALEDRGYDLASRLMPVPPGEPVTALVSLDSPQLPHDRLAELIERLHAAGVRGIGLLLPLRADTPMRLPELLAEVEEGSRKLRERRQALQAEPRPSGAAARERRARRLAELRAGEQQLDVVTYWLRRADTDRPLVEAVRRAGDVVLAAWGEAAPRVPALGLEAVAGLGVEPAHAWYLRPALAPLYRGPAPAPLSVEGPFEALAAAAPVGLVAPMEAGLQVGLPLAVPAGDGAAAGFVTLLAARGLAVADRDVTAIPGYGLRLGYHPVVTGPGWRLMPWPWRDGALPVLPAERLLRGEGLEALKDKTVVVGPTGGGATLRTVGGARLAPAQWVGHAVDSLLRGRTVTIPPWYHLAQRGLLLALALYLLLLPGRLIGAPGGLLTSLLLGVIALNAGLVTLITQQLWLPVVGATLFLWLAHAVLALQARYEARLHRGEQAAAEARTQLGLHLQAQGQLDAAFEQLRRVPPGDTLLHHLYQLGHDYERRRQYTKAHAVYEFMAGYDPAYRDIDQRQARLKPLSGERGPAGATHSSVAPTLVLDDPALAKPMIGRYQIEAQLGRGAMGVVYLGIDPKIGRKVAIKTLNLTQEFDTEELQEVKMRFYREAEASGRLQHPNIVAVYDVGEEHDLAYIAMDYVSGHSLDQYVRPGSLLSVEEVLRIGVQVAEALDYAHRQNVVHRDIKPANIIYDADKQLLKITDFGIACLTDNSKTRSGTLLGTPAYMSPEQITGEQVDGRSDLFSLGITLYHLLTGKLPFTGDSMAKLVYKITSEKPEDLRRLRPELPSALSRVLAKCLQKSPDKRYQTGANVAAALQRVLDQWIEDQGEDADSDTSYG